MGKGGFAAGERCEERRLRAVLTRTPGPGEGGEILGLCACGDAAPGGGKRRTVSTDKEARGKDSL